MAETSKIEWTDATWNPITGCSVVSPGCTNCYAMKLAGTRLQHHPSRAGLTKPSKAGPVWTGEVRLNEKWLFQPLGWQRPRKIFVCAHGDLFAEGVPDEWIDIVFAVMALCPCHTFQVLTKRPERMRQYLNGPFTDDGVCARIAEAVKRLPGGIAATRLASFTEMPIGPIMNDGEPEFGYRLFMRPQAWPLPNVWLGVSVEDQARAKERIPLLLNTPAAVRFVSAEPLLGPVDFSQLQDNLPLNAWLTWLDGLDWVIVGGESGPNARPMHPDWVRSIRDQCAIVGAPFLFKQWGEWFRFGEIDADACHNTVSKGKHPHFWHEWGGEISVRLGKKAAGRHLDGVIHDGFPGGSSCAP